MRLRPQFEPRDWQDRFVREYQTNTKKNFLLEACTSAGKTAGALYAYIFLKDGLDWRFLVSIVPSEHLKRQYAQDAKKLFGLNLYYSGTSTRIGRLPTPQELQADGYEGLVLSYQWLTKLENAESLKQELEQSVKEKVFLILDEVHHASSELAFGQACEIAFPDHVVSHRLMTSGTPFRSDQNRILGNWVNYASVEENVYECLPDFRYTLAEALREGVIPAFSFVTLAGEFTYRRGQFEYEGKTFTDAQNEQELTDALNTAIYVEGGWVQNAIEWAHSRMKRDRAKGLPECATYVRVPTIQAARKMKERILRLTRERALVVVSKDDDPNSTSNALSKQKSSELQGDSALFELLRQEYETAIGSTGINDSNILEEDIPDGFPSEYGTWHPDEKRKYASKEAHTKAQRLAYILYPDGKKVKIANAIKDIHTQAKRRCEVSLTGHIGHKGWEKIYLWLLDRIAHAHQLKGTEDL